MTILLTIASLHAAIHFVFIIVKCELKKSGGGKVRIARSNAFFLNVAPEWFQGPCAFVNTNLLQVKPNIKQLACQDL